MSVAPGRTVQSIRSNSANGWVGGSPRVISRFRTCSAWPLPFMLLAAALTREAILGGGSITLLDSEVDSIVRSVLLGDTGS